MKKQRFVTLAAAIIWILALAFIFQFDLAGEISDGAPVIFSGTDQAMAISIDTGDWRAEIPPPGMGSWNEPLRTRRLRSRVPILFPEDRQSWVDASLSGSSAERGIQSGRLFLQFQYASSEISPAQASNALSNLAAAYLDELAVHGIKAKTEGAPIVRDADIRLLYIVLMGVKALAASLAALTLTLFLLWIDRSRLSVPKILGVTGSLILTGFAGLLLVQFEFITTPQFAGLVPDSILLAQRVTATNHAPAPNAMTNTVSRREPLDWKAVPESHFWRREMVKRDYPDISDKEASDRVASYPFDTSVMRGETIGLAPGWYFTLRVPKSLADRIDPATSTNLQAERAMRDAWLSSLFTHMKNGFESSLASTGTSLASQGNPEFVYDYPPTPPLTRLRAALAMLLSGMGLLWWLRRLLG